MTATTETVTRAMRVAGDAAARVQHPAASTLTGVRAGMLDLVEHLREFAAGCGDIEDVRAELNMLAQELHP